MQLVHGGEDYFTTLEKLIAGAQHEIHLQTYIYASDETGTRITKALTEAANRGVSVYLIMDAYGSKNISRQMLAQFREAKINYRFFGNFRSPGWLAWGRRLHHKIVVVDREYALVGGINISNDYSGMGGKPPWLDYALLLQGPVAYRVFKVCYGIYSQWFQIPFRRFKPFDTTIPAENKTVVQLRLNDWLQGKNQIAQSYMRAIYRAKTEIIIANSYFMPGTFLRQALKRASQRGVKVIVLLPGLSDVPLMLRATRWLYDYLLRYNIDIYELQNGILHAKVATIDGRWSTIGSYNLNFLSAYGSIEFNTDVVDERFGDYFRQHLQQVLKNDCRHIIKNDYLKKLNIFQRFLNWCSYRIIKLSSSLLITFPGQKIFSKNRFA